MDKETSSKIQELHMLERNLQSLMAQKQAIQLEIAETENALDEVKKTSSEIYKLTGSIMLKADKSAIMKELEEKHKLMHLRMSSIEKQESLLESKAEELKKEAMKMLENNSKTGKNK